MKEGKENFFNELGLKNIDVKKFASRNLIIGKNGSGKTRFLKALERTKKLEGDSIKRKINVVTLYFPEIHTYYSQLKGEQVPEDYESVYDFLRGDAEISFCDFLKAMENDRARFGNNLIYGCLMEGRSRRETDEIVKRLNRFLNSFIRKNIVVNSKDRKVFIIDASDDNNERTMEIVEALYELSPGELLLFYLAVFLTVIESGRYGELILILDEPELHLHPRALLDFMKMLQEITTISEMWIASHSFFLLPYFEFNEIIYIENSIVINRDSKTYSKLYDSLIGIADIDTFELLSSIENWQYYNFIVECFCRPEVVGRVDPDDEQFKKFLEQIRKLSHDRPLEILDYGAGKCRIWECLHLLQLDDGALPEIFYTAYDPVADERTYNKLNQGTTSGGKLCSAYYKNLEDIPEYQNKFDAVVLMNVLHEIPANLWLKVFTSIYNCLSNEGILIFAEAMKLSKGEQPYSQNGYLLLQEKEVERLFDDKNVKKVVFDKQNKSNCWIITKKQLEKVNLTTIQRSLVALRENCEQKLRTKYNERIRMADENGKDEVKKMLAREYAFLSQQYINVKFALEDIDEDPIFAKIEKMETEMKKKSTFVEDSEKNKKITVDRVR